MITADGTPNRTRIARSAADTERLAASARTLPVLDGRVERCRACPRLVQWREEVARTKRRAFADQTYWGRPVAGFGPADSRIAVLGLAPAAHGANRTGRIFTGDRSGDWLFASLYRVGLANQPTSVSSDDGLRLNDIRIISAVRCAPPANVPTPTERDTCSPWFERELALLWPTLRVVVVLGGFGWSALWPALGRAAVTVPARRPAFAHGAEVSVPRADGAPFTVLGCYHVSQQNTFTGRLTEPMLDAVFTRAIERAG
ncbi:MAG TPA: uracil-DNA glycosylase [Mycobacteriales bacterium]|nr:uracil-DNA glycosylase [Mycobacteriales bacterium]